MTLSNTLVEDPAEPGTYLLDPFEPNVQQVITSEGTGAILFGADPTGNTPVQDELLAASRLASGRNLPLIVTDGNYLITDAPGLPNDLTIMCAANARFFGNRPGGNLLWIQSKVRIYGGIFENTSSEACFDINVVGGSGVEFHGVTFKGGGANGIFLNWPGIDELLVDNCLFDTLVYGMLLNPGAGDAKNITIRRSRFRNIAADAVEINNMTSGGSTRVEGFKFIDNPEVRCDANVSGTSAGFGLGLAGCSEFTITGNTFLECRNETVHIEDHSSGGVIADNTIRGGSNNERGAIVIYQSCADIRVHDNVIRDFPAKGVAVVYDGNGASKDISIQNNTIVNCGKTAIQVGGEKLVRVLTLSRATPSSTPTVTVSRSSALTSFLWSRTTSSFPPRMPVFSPPEQIQPSGTTRTTLLRARERSHSTAFSRPYNRKTLKEFGIVAGSGLFDEALPVTTSMKQYRNPELFKQPLPVYFPEGQPGGSNIREDPDDPGTFLID